eukprot:5591603-Prymnesium_polylepis.1
MIVPSVALPLATQPAAVPHQEHPRRCASHVSAFMESALRWRERPRPLGCIGRRLPVREAGRQDAAIGAEAPAPPLCRWRLVSAGASRRGTALRLCGHAARQAKDPHRAVRHLEREITAPVQHNGRMHHRRAWRIHHRRAAALRGTRCRHPRPWLCHVQVHVASRLPLHLRRACPRRWHRSRCCVHCDGLEGHPVVGLDGSRRRAPRRLCADHRSTCAGTSRHDGAHRGRRLRVRQVAWPQGSNSSNVSRARTITGTARSYLSTPPSPAARGSGMRTTTTGERSAISASRSSRAHRRFPTRRCRTKPIRASVGTRSPWMAPGWWCTASWLSIRKMTWSLGAASAANHRRLVNLATCASSLRPAGGALLCAKAPTRLGRGECGLPRERARAHRDWAWRL